MFKKRGGENKLFFGGGPRGEPRVPDTSVRVVENRVRINETEGGGRNRLSWLTSEFRLSDGRFYGRKRIWAVRSKRVGSKGIRLNLGLSSVVWKDREDDVLRPRSPIRPACEIMWTRLPIRVTPVLRKSATTYARGLRRRPPETPETYNFPIISSRVCVTGLGNGAD